MERGSVRPCPRPCPRVPRAGIRRLPRLEPTGEPPLVSEVRAFALRIEGPRMRKRPPPFPLLGGMHEELGCERIGRGPPRPVRRLPPLAAPEHTERHVGRERPRSPRMRAFRHAIRFEKPGWAGESRAAGPPCRPRDSHVTARLYLQTLGTNGTGIPRASGKGGKNGKKSRLRPGRGTPWEKPGLLECDPQGERAQRACGPARRARPVGNP